uniref:Cryptide Pep-18 n=1 Tax=Tityus obscurus TaxID=1221240 RepID=CRY18_TITOB
KETNAKPP